MKKLLLISIALLLLFTLSACSKKGGDSSKKIIVGAKNYTEQYVLGNIFSIMLQENGFEVTEKFGTGSSIVREGLETGQIDLYPEFTGTAWTAFFGKEEKINDAAELFEECRKIDAENGIVWMYQGKYNNTYALAYKKGNGADFGDTLSDFAEYTKSNPDLKMSLDHEFFERPDGFFAMAELYGVQVKKENVKTMDIGLSYEALDRGQVDVAMVFSTDGLLKKFKLFVLEDDKAFFPIYNVGPIARKEILEKYPEINDILTPVMDVLDTDTIISLNYKVDAEGLPEKMVAEEFLKEKGFIK